MAEMNKARVLNFLIDFLGATLGFCMFVTLVALTGEPVTQRKL